MLAAKLMFCTAPVSLIDDTHDDFHGLRPDSWTNEVHADEDEVGNAQARGY